MKRLSKSGFEEESKIKEEAARFLRALQCGEYCTEQDMIKSSPKFEKILARYFTVNNNNNSSTISTNNYPIEGSNFYRRDNWKKDNLDIILDADYEESCEEESAYAYTISQEDCWNCPGYWVSYFIAYKDSSCVSVNAIIITKSRRP